MVAQSATPDFDAAALTARQAALRLFVEDIADHVMARQLPESYLEAERAVRAVAVSDRFLQAVPVEASERAQGPVLPPTVTSLCSAPPPPHVGEYKEEAPSGATSRATSPRGGEEKDDAPTSPVRDPYRLRLRGYADKVMEAATYILKPDSFLEAERAQRYAWSANRMLIQLYAPPVERPASHLRDNTANRRDKTSELSALQRATDAVFGPEDDDEPDEADYAEWFRKDMWAFRDWDNQIRAGKDLPPPVGPHNDDPGYKEYLAVELEKKLAPYRENAEREARASGKPWPPPEWSIPLEERFPDLTPEQRSIFTRRRPPPDTSTA